MTPQDMAAIHAQCFTDAPPPWQAGAIAATLDHPGAFLCTRPGAFLIGRATAGEAELLTIATAPAARRRGHARALMADFAAQARRRGAAQAFLEVAAGNAAALALYHAAGWAEVGRRPRYYAGRVDAVILRLGLGCAEKAG